MKRWPWILALVLALCVPIGYVAADRVGVMVNGVYYLDIGGLLGTSNFDPTVPFAVLATSFQFPTALTSPPATPVVGTVYPADGVNWNPCSLSQVSQTIGSSVLTFTKGSPDTITTTGTSFVALGYLGYQNLLISGTTHNNLTVQIASVAAGTLTLTSSNALTNESPASATLTARYSYNALYTGIAYVPAGVDYGGVFSASNFGQSQLTATFYNGGSVLATTGANSIAYTHRDYALTLVKWTVMCDGAASDSTPIIINVGGKVTSAPTAGAYPTIGANGFCGGGTPPTGSSSVNVNQAAWNCTVANIAANEDIVFNITQAPTASTKCTVIVETQQ